MRKEEYQISVIVPVYNKEKYLCQCMDSILGQTYSSLDIVLVDDGSADKSGEICDGYAKRDERVRVIHQKNTGSTAAVLRGLEEASGDYYAFIDSDDYVSPEMLEEMTGHLSGRKGEIVCCNYVLEKQKETVPVIQGLRRECMRGAAGTGNKGRTGRQRKQKDPHVPLYEAL